MVKISNIYHILIDEAFDIVDKAECQIEQEALSEGVKGLVGIWWLHDEKISSIESNKKFIIIRFDAYNIEYCFILVKGSKCKNFENYVGGTVLYTELFRNVDYTYEFNVLLYDEYGQLQEFSIHFYDVEIREAYL